MIKKTQSVNSVMLRTTPPIAVGIEVSIGKGLYLIWAGFVTLVISIVPYMVRSVVSSRACLNPFKILTAVVPTEDESATLDAGHRNIIQNQGHLCICSFICYKIFFRGKLCLAV